MNIQANQVVAGLTTVLQWPTARLLRVALIVSVLVGIQALLQAGFTCPCRNPDSHAYGVYFFVAPGLAFMCLNGLVREDWKDGGGPRSVLCAALAKATLPILMWVMVVLLDGDAFACIMTSYEVCYSNCTCTQQAVCRFKEKVASEEEQFCYRYWIYQSKSYGMLLLVFLAFIALIYKKWPHLSPCRQHNQYGRVVNQEVAGDE